MSAALQDMTEVEFLAAWLAFKRRLWWETPRADGKRVLNSDHVVGWAVYPYTDGDGNSGWKHGLDDLETYSDAEGAQGDLADAARRIGYTVGPEPTGAERDAFAAEITRRRLYWALVWRGLDLRYVSNLAHVAARIVPFGMHVRLEWLVGPDPARTLFATFPEAHAALARHATEQRFYILDWVIE